MWGYKTADINKRVCDLGRQWIKRGSQKNGEKMTVERRKFKRHGVPESAYFVFDHDTSEMAMIKDISMGGLKLEYVSIGKDIIEWHKIDIFGNKGSRFHIFGIFCKQIYAIDELAENRTFSGSRSRAAGLKFVTLNAAQQIKLESLINQLGMDATSTRGHHQRSNLEL